RRFTLFPYTTLFRSHGHGDHDGGSVGAGPREEGAEPVRRGAGDRWPRGGADGGRCKACCRGLRRRRGFAPHISSLVMKGEDKEQDRKSTRLNSSHGS